MTQGMMDCSRSITIILSEDYASLTRSPETQLQGFPRIQDTFLHHIHLLESLSSFKSHTVTVVFLFLSACLESRQGRVKLSCLTQSRWLFHHRAGCSALMMPPVRAREHFSSGRDHSSLARQPSCFTSQTGRSSLPCWVNLPECPSPLVSQFLFLL